MAWAVASVGYRVPRSRFEGVVRAVFARACYVEHAGALVTLAADGVANGPTTILMHGGADLRGVVAPGDAVILDLTRAKAWRPRAPRSLLDRRDRTRRAALARERLGEARRTRSSVLDRSGAAAITGVEEACRELDIGAARTRIGRFVGWGEGLTPAGDDYLVGLCAALRALAGRDAARRAFLRELAQCIASLRARTTPVSGHYLALAANGDFNADVLDARDALRAGRDDDRACVAFDDLLAVGSTSGADALTGTLCGFAAWDPPYDQDEP
jgi:Protein of unknown function (DUF2877)